MFTLYEVAGSDACIAQMYITVTVAQFAAQKYCYTKVSQYLGKKQVLPSYSFKV